MSKSWKNKENQRLSDGRYVYYRWDDELKREVPVFLTSGSDGVTEEILLVMTDLDHEEELQERYEEENRDYETENQKQKVSAGDEEATDPIESLADRRQDPFSLLDGTQEENALVEQLLVLMQKLTPQQIDLIYSLFGEQKYMADIAREQGKTRQAVNNQKNKIINRLKKLFEAAGVQ